MPLSFWAGYLEKLAIVALALAALYLIARALRRARIFTHAGQSLALLESLMLSQHAALHVVRVGTRYFLIGSASGGVWTLAELAPADAAPQTLK